MITTERKGTIVTIKVELWMGIFPFSFNTGAEWSAMALESILKIALQDRISTIRSQEYRAGLRDARKKKEERKVYFHRNFDL